MTSIASQLQAIKSAVKGAADPVRRPATCPSVICDPKEAADLDLRYILAISRSALEVLVQLDPQFERYLETLFSHTSLEIDRERMEPKEEVELNKEIVLFLGLLAGHLNHFAALQTLEYLIRRYRIHVHNEEELIMCALWYHNTDDFVRIVRLLELRNKKWAFLEGVKASGAPPPRTVIVQQCIHDKGVLETLCNYASPMNKASLMKNFQQSRRVICFCSTVIIEALGSVPKLDHDSVERVLTFVKPQLKGSRDHKAGALMVVGLLATRATLEAKVVQNLILSIAKVAQHDARQSEDLPWLRIVILAILSLVQQMHTTQLFSKKITIALNKIRDFVGILAGLFLEFNIRNFVGLYVESLVDYSKTDESCVQTLINAIKTLPMKDIIDKIAMRVIAHRVNLQSGRASMSNEAGIWERILVIIDKHYPSELRRAVRKHLETCMMKSQEQESTFSSFCQIFGEYLDLPMEIPDSKFWFSLEHPKAAVRRSTLSAIATSNVVKHMAANPEKLKNVQYAILRRLHDEDLSVIQTTLTIDGLSEIIDPTSLLSAYHDVLVKCTDIIDKSKTEPAKASDVAMLCLEHMILDFGSCHSEYSQDIATMIFPLIIVLPKTWKVNLKALELFRHVKWSFFFNMSVEYEPTLEQVKSVDSGNFFSINKQTIGALAEALTIDPHEHKQWLVKCSKNGGKSKTLFLLLLLRALVAHNGDFGSLLKIYKAYSPTLRHEWHEMESRGIVIPSQKMKFKKLDKSFLGFVEQLFTADTDALNIKILIYIYGGLLKAYHKSARRNTAEVKDVEWLLGDLFLFFATSPLKTIFQKRLLFLVRNRCKDPLQFLLKYYAEEDCCVEVQVESLSSFASICSRFALSERRITDEHLLLLLGFPSLLIPLANENKDIRAAAVNCVEVISKLWRSFDASLLENGNDVMLPIILTFVDFVEAIVSQKQLIISDVNFLPTYLASLLSPLSSSLLVPINTHKRFDQPAKGAILRLIMSSTLKLSSYGKIMVLSLLKGVGNAMLDVEEVKSLLFELLKRRKELFELLKRRKEYHCRIDTSHQELSTVEIKILCLLLEISLTVSGSAGVAADVLDRVIVEGPYSEDPTVVEPYVTVMENLTSGLYDTLKPEMQDKLLRQLILLFRSDNGNVRNTARETLLRVNIFSSVARFLRMIVDYDQNLSKITRRGKASIRSCSLTREDSFNKVETIISLSSLLDILLLKKDLEKGDSLVEPLFQLLGKLFSNGWLLSLIGQSDGGSGVLSQVPETITGAIYYAQQTALIILKHFIDSLLLECSLKDDVLNKSHVDLLIECARSTEDNATRNHIFMILSSVAKIFSGRLAEHITDIFTIIGESAVMQSDSHSQNVLEDLIATLVPCWLTKVDGKADSIEKLLQIFINALPEIAEHRRVALMVYLLRTLGENTSFDLLVAHLLRSLITRLYKSSELERNINDLLSSLTIFGEWEYTFALELCDQYSCKVWFPCLVKLLQHIRLLTNPEEQVYELYLSMNFITDKLQDTELVFALESGQDADYLQDAFVELMEQVVLHLQLARARSRQLPLSSGFLKVLMECANKILNTITRWMVPSKYFKGITQLLDHPDAEVKKKTLRLLSETMKDHSSAQNKSKQNKRKQRFSSFLLHERDSNFFNVMCLKIVHLVDSTLDESEIPLKLAALSSIEVLTKVLPSGNGIYVTCLACIVKHIASADLAISSSCLRTVSALISILQSKSLPQLPNIMKHLLERAHEISPCPIGKKKSPDSVTSDGIASSKMSVLISILTTLEAVVENLAGFVNPYLEDILNLVVLHPEYALDIDQKLKVKATSVRKLLAEKIPARLLLSPLLRMYANAVECGKSNLSLALEMIASMVSGMDRSSIVSYHTKIYEQCLLALDLRRQHPESLKDISMVEESVIHAMIVLTLKLTETTFRPLFLHSLEWAESEIETSESTQGRSIDRAISFYKLVNKLIEHHRSLFVPYFKYLLDGCTRYFTENQDDDSTTLAPKRKKAKIGNSQNRAKDEGGLPQKMWHLRALILKSLHKCFLYDTTDLKFLDSSNFQVLLKPIVSQLVVDPPASLELSSDLPTVEEVDESLVLCLGQMAVTARSDVLWKPLNHEVLMQTRNEKVRPKILGLKVVKYFVEHLKEEYLVFLAESIPYLGELLEDVELPVKSLAQEILKEMELLSGESLWQYL